MSKKKQDLNPNDLSENKETPSGIGGNSRFWGGVHFQDSIDNMRHLGSEIGTSAYVFVQAHIEGFPK